MGMLSAIGWISAADHVVFRRDRGRVAPLSLSLGERKETSTLFSIYHFDLSDTFVPSSLDVFQKEKKRENERALHYVLPSWMKKNDT